MMNSQEEYRKWADTNPITVNPGDIARLRPNFNGRQQLFCKLFVRQDFRPLFTKPEQLFEWTRTREKLKTVLRCDEHVVVLTQPETRMDVAVMLPNGQIGFINPRKLELVSK